MLTLSVLEPLFAVCKIKGSQLLPEWATKGEFWTISKTSDEVSIVCDQNFIPPEVTAEKNWRAIKVLGPLDFSLTGILSSIANPLAENKISIFAISTFDTDYILIKQSELNNAVNILSKSGFKILNPKS